MKEIVWLLIIAKHSSPLLYKNEVLRFKKFMLQKEYFEKLKTDVYLRAYAFDRVDYVVERIKAEMPKDSRIEILKFTDEQFGQIKNLYK